MRGTIDADESKKLLEELTLIPGKLEALLTRDEETEDLAKQYHRAHDFLFLGRGIHYPIALEGALKLKEISYIHAEGYPAGEMKHGPNALIDEDLPVVIMATRDLNDPGSVLRYEKTLSNLKEVKARSGTVIAIATEGDEDIREAADHVLYVPRCSGAARADSRSRSLPAAGVSHRRAPRLRRRPASQSGEVGNRRIGGYSLIPYWVTSKSCCLWQPRACAGVVKVLFHRRHRFV